MAIDVEIQDDRGVAIAQYDGPPLGMSFLELASPGSSCFRFIDPWGDATFNQKQIAVLLDELQDATKNTSHLERLNELISLIRFAEWASGRDVYLKFIGD